jgi:integrase
MSDVGIAPAGLYMQQGDEVHLSRGVEKAPKRGKVKDRGNGDGSLWGLADGRWRWQLTVRVVNGKQGRVSGIEATKSLAKRALEKAQADRDRGLLASPDRVTVAEHAESWLKSQDDLSKRSISTYKKELSYALEHIGAMKVRDVRAMHIKNLMDALKTRVMGRRDESGNPIQSDGKTMSGRTLSKVMIRLRSLFREAVALQIIYANPCEGVKRPKMQAAEVVGTILDFDQKARFQELGEALYEAGSCILWPALFTALSIGLRRSEVMGLRWQDVDLERGVLSIRHTSVLQDSGFDLGERTKTNKSRRDIPIPPSLKAMLERHRAAQHLEREKAGNAWRDSGAVFSTALGWWVSPDNLNRALENVLAWSDSKHLLNAYVPDGKPSRTAMKREEMTNLERRLRAVTRDHRAKLEAIVRAGEKLPDISPHDLRHTYATLALRRGVPVEVVSKTLGHARISITLDIYRHVLESEMKEHVFDMFEMPLPVRAVPVSVVN